jgi:hypothetical protein
MTTATVPTIVCDGKCENLAHLYILFYRHGLNANLTKGFHHAGDLRDARQRAEKHCKIMNYKFIFVRNMICDFEADEDYKLHGHIEGELIP